MFQSWVQEEWVGFNYRAEAREKGAGEARSRRSSDRYARLAGRRGTVAVTDAPCASLPGADGQARTPPEPLDEGRDVAFIRQLLVEFIVSFSGAREADISLDHHFYFWMDGSSPPYPVFSRHPGRFRRGRASAGVFERFLYLNCN